MTLKQYVAFTSAVDNGSISKAAILTGNTQSGLTHLIISLEKELGFTLMTRTKKGITLTEEGRRLYPVIKDCVNSDKRIYEITAKIKGERSNVINIATFSSVAVKWLPAIMHEFKEIHPETEFSIINGGYGEVNSALEDGRADVGFITLPSAVNLKTYPLYNDRILAVIPKNSTLCSLEKIPVKTFEIEPVICLDEKTDLDSRSVFEKQNVKPNIKYRTADDYAMISMVENNLGICLEPELLLLGRDSSVTTKELEPSAYRTIALAVPFEKQANKLTNAFSEFILKWVNENVKSDAIV